MTLHFNLLLLKKSGKIGFKDLYDVSGSLLLSKRLFKNDFKMTFYPRIIMKLNMYNCSNCRILFVITRIKYSGHSAYPLKL